MAKFPASRATALSAALLASLPLLAQAAPVTPPVPPHQKWSFEGPVGQFDQKSLQRGFVVFH